MIPNIAIVVPQNNAVSETFISAHRDMMRGNIFYLFGGFIPTYSSMGKLGRNNRFFNGILKLLPYRLYLKYRPGPEDACIDFLRSRKIHVVLAEYGQTACGVLPICKKLSIPLIVHFHGADASKHAVLEAYKEQYTQLFAYARFIVGVSRKMMQRLSLLGAPADKLVYAVYGPNEHFFDVMPDYENGYFLSVGRFVDKKAPYLTLLAFQKVLDHCPEACLVMVGDGPLFPVCKQMVHSLGIRNVSFRGALPHEKVKALFSGARCFVQHSIVAEDGDAEGTPVAVLEAGAAALPVVSTIHEGIPDVVVHGVTGFLVDEGDITAMAGYMTHLYTDNRLCREIGENARKHIAADFSLRKHIDILDGLVTKCMEKRRD